jgi:hypothetical protein
LIYETAKVYDLFYKFEIQGLVMSLNKILARWKVASRKLIPPDKLTIMDRAQEELSQSRITDSCLREGDLAPRFELPNATGQNVSLQDLLTKGPLVLSFYRGGW